MDFPAPLPWVDEFHGAELASLSLNRLFPALATIVDGRGFEPPLARRRAVEALPVEDAAFVVVAA